MYMQNDIVAAPSSPRIRDRHIDATRQPDELNQIVVAATAAMPAHILEVLGSLSPALARNGDHCIEPQIRSEPIGASRCEFRYPVPASAPELSDVDGMVTALVAAAVQTAYSIPALEEWVERVRTMAERAIRPTNGALAPIEITAIGVTPYFDGDEFETTIDFTTLGSDLKPTTQRVSESELFRLEENLKQRVATHIVRREVLAAAMVAGVTGWVDDAALGIMAAAGLDRAETLGMLATTRDIEFSFGGEHGEDRTGELFWENGVIRCYVEQGAAFQLEGSELSIPKVLPGTIVATLPGRCLRDVVDLELIPANALIVEVVEDPSWLKLRLEIGRTPIEEAGRSAG